MEVPTKLWMIELHQFESLQGHFRRPHLRRVSEPLASVDTRVEHLQDTLKLVFAEGINLAKGHYGSRYRVWILVILAGVPTEQFLIYRTGPSCLIRWFDGVILSQEWKEALWDKFVMGAPRPRS